jgi:putative endonuclease
MGVATWFVYVLACGDETLYTGITNDPDRRLAAHQRGTASKYTRGRRPVRMIYREPLSSRSEALRREAWLKKLDRGAKLRLIAAAETRR